MAIAVSEDVHGRVAVKACTLAAATAEKRAEMVDASAWNEVSVVIRLCGE